MAKVRILPDRVANQIAAGEVIERPAAVVKELVENALDAGAKHIDVDLLEGGRKLVRVRDDGSGMSREDAELSLQRHATSKLRSKEDLFAIRSYGFRGEALPSMAAVSRFSLLTCEPGALQGTRIEVDGSARNVWLFVNGRAIRDRSLTHAVLRAYGELLPHGRYPGAIVFLELPPAEVDVNVHPAKAEVRLADPRAAWEAISSGLTSVLARGAWVPPAPERLPAQVYSMPLPRSERAAEPLQLYAQPQLIAPSPYFRGLR